MTKMNLIAGLSAAALAGSAAASVTVVSGGTQSAWQTSAPASIHGTPSSSFWFNTDDLSNATNASATTVTGGYGWGQYLASGTSTTVQAVNVGGAREIFTSAGGNVTLAFNTAGMAMTSTTGIYGMWIEFGTVPTNNVNLTITFDNGGSASFSAATAGSISIWKTDGTSITSVTFAPNAQTTGSQSIVIETISFGFVPTPGAVALVGVAGLVGSRRRRA